MTNSRAAAIWCRVAERAACRGDPVSVADGCAVALETVGIDSAVITVAVGDALSHAMFATDEAGEQFAELELTLGEGPCAGASASGGPVLEPDLSARSAARRWPAFAPAACRAGAAAVFAFPLRLAATQAGVLALYRSRPGALNWRQLRDAFVFADVAAVLLLEGQVRTGPAGPAGQSAKLASCRAQIDQATGMLSEQLGVGVAEAFLRLRAHAYARGSRLGDVARDVVARRLLLGAAARGGAEE